MIDLLIVDDEPATRKVIKMFLGRSDLKIDRIYEACNGQEALEFIRQDHVPCIIITDMDMPILNGVQFLEYLTDCHPEIKVLVVSGYIDFQYTHAAIKAGTVDYILKPVDPHKLCVAIQKCIDAVAEQQYQQSIRIDHQTQLDIETYKVLQKTGEKIRWFLDSGQYHKILPEMERIYDVFPASPYPTAAEVFIAQLLSNILRYYCVMHDYIGHNSVKTIPIMIGSKLKDAEDLYVDILHRIQEEQAAQSMDLILERIKKYIDESFRLPLRQESIAASFFVNKEYMSVMFRRKFNITMGAYITQLKMEESKRLLADPNIPIVNIAHMVGYEDPAYFNRAFKKYTGDSPGKYRTNIL